VACDQHGQHLVADHTIAKTGVDQMLEEIAPFFFPLPSFLFLLS
jgi:hypothetical protein